MSILAVPVDQRVIDIDSRRFASIEKALVELITNSDDSYTRQENNGLIASGTINLIYERHLSGAVLTITDQAEGLGVERLRSILTYGGAHSPLSKGEISGRGYFGRGLKQAVFGLGHGWIESIQNGRFARVDLFRDENSAYMYNDFDGDRPAEPEDYRRLSLRENSNGTQVNIIVDNPLVNIPFFQSLISSLANNIYLRDVLQRRHLYMASLQRGKSIDWKGPVRFEEPASVVLVGPDESGSFTYHGQKHEFKLTLKRAQGVDLTLKGDERTSGLLVVAGNAVLDCQFFRYENQLGTEYLFGSIRAPILSTMLGQGMPIISDDRDGLNMKDSFVIAFTTAVSDMIAPYIKAEQARLSQIDRAITSDRTRTMIDHLLQRMNRVAVEDLRIITPYGPGSGTYGPYPSGRPAALRFTTPFYYRKVNHPFHVTLIIDRSQFTAKDILTVSYLLPPSVQVEPTPLVLTIADIGESDRFEWTFTGSQVKDQGRIGVTSGRYAAWCEIVIAADTSGAGYHHPSGKPPRVWDQDNSADLFAGYEIRNLNNELDRAVYIPEERLIIINTGAPTVRLYVDGRGHFRDAARLLLAELFMDVIADELARRYVDRSSHKGDIDTYRAVKQDLIRRYGTEIHRSFLNE
ncbi:MAG: hypothetical protein H6Q66_1608 [Firmicutes bacterium]|nr:hypothetical protein [Bacillota bacterium]